MSTSSDELPSDVTSDVGEALEQRVFAPVVHNQRSLLHSITTEQAGLLAAAVVTFLGVAVIGPKLLELRQPRANLGYKAQRTAREARLRAEAAGLRAQKRLRRLGGGTIRR